MNEFPFFWPANLVAWNIKWSQFMSALMKLEWWCATWWNVLLKLDVNSHSLVSHFILNGDKKKTESESRVNGDLVQMFFFWEGSPNNSSKTMHKMIFSAETSAGNCCEPGTGPFFSFLDPCLLYFWVQSQTNSMGLTAQIKGLILRSSCFFSPSNWNPRAAVSLFSVSFHLKR